MKLRRLKRAFIKSQIQMRHTTRQIAKTDEGSVELGIGTAAIGLFFGAAALQNARQPQPVAAATDTTTPPAITQPAPAPTEPTVQLGGLEIPVSQLAVLANDLELTSAQRQRLCARYALPTTTLTTTPDQDLEPAPELTR